MVEPPLRPPGNSPACASEWLLARAVRGAIDESERARLNAALDRCAHCRERWEATQAEQAAARSESLPADLRALVERPRVRGRWVLSTSLGAVAAVAAVLVVVARPTQPSSFRTKGHGLTVTASVMRNGTVVRHDVAAETLGPLAAGDRLRLRVTPARGHALVEGREGGRWVPYFAGAVPHDGWLPIGIVVTPPGASMVRITSCPNEPASAAVDAVPPGCLREVVTF